MGLVDYSDSESDSEPVAQPAPAPAVASTASGKKPFQKIIDRSQPGKIRVSLPQTAGSDTSKAADGDDGRPTKRARVAGGGGAFSGFNSFLPAPKNTRKPVAATAASGSGSSSGKTVPRPGVNLKTGAAPGFSREAVDEDGAYNDEGDAEPTTKQPSIPTEQKPADEVKLVGKPLMFRPLSVSRKPGKKNTPKSTNASTAPPVATPAAPQTSQTPAPKREAEAVAGPPPPKKQKISLFSIPDESSDTPTEESTPNGTYEPMFTTTAPDDFAAYDQQFSTSTTTSNPHPTPSAHTDGPSSTATLSAVAASMNLSTAARRELFGRGGAAASNAVITNFDTSAEYAHNEFLRTSGAANQQPAYKRAPAPAPAGKSSLRQLVSQAQNHRETLEEGFAAGKSSRGEAGARYGWR